MNSSPILITSFQTWRAHQLENSSQVLIAQLQQKRSLPANVVWLPNLQVNFDLAPTQVITQIWQHRPKLILCCGMAEKRPHLSLERGGQQGDQRLETCLDVDSLAQASVCTQVSENAGSFVCNHLYYHVLAYLKSQCPSTQALFVHIPALNPHNQAVIEFDFVRLVQQLNTLL
ncbi:MAG: peptidase C15 [Leptolyngbya sp. SIO4C1]|nr:peptidase C15 [Leptolyngbya sp. SIO4C1]